jgi:hypothetical protein
MALQLHYKFDESSGSITNDSSGNGYSGTLINGPIFQSGLIKNAILFDGVDSFVQMDSNDLSFERTDSFSMSLWVKGTNLRCLVSKHSPNNGNQGYWLTFLNTGTLRFFIANGITNRIVVEASLASIGSIKTNNIWQHFVVTYDGTSLASGIKIYLNNVLLTLSTIQNNLTGTIIHSEPLTIGAWETSIESCEGVIDDVRVYDHILSVSEINQIYCAVPKYWWTLDDSGPVISAAITSYGSGGTGLVNAASTNHGLQNGQYVLITGVGGTNYNGYKKVSAVTTNTFKFPGTYTASITSGTWIRQNVASSIRQNDDLLMLNGPTVTNGIINNAFLFDGIDDKLSTDRTQIFPIDKSFSLNFWFKRDDLTHNGTMIYWGDASSYTRFEIGWASNQFYVRVTRDPNIFMYYPALNIGGAKLDTNWHQLCFIFPVNAGNMVTYLDGQQIISTPKGYKELGSSAYTVFMQVGWGFGASTTWYKGKIDQIQLFNDYLLSPVEVLDLYEEGVGPLLCWNYKARYKNSSRMFVANGGGKYPSELRVPSSVDISTGMMIDEGKLIDNNQFKIIQ